MSAVPRPRPCASCPFRQQVPSGVWAAEEYRKLPAYDGETFDQPTRAFFCHQSDGHVCSGWLGFRDPQDLLAVRLGIATGHLDPSCATYRTTVPLFESAAAATAHGLRDIDDPSPAAITTMRKITEKQTRS